MSDILIKGIQMPKSCLGELDGRNDCPIVGICENFKKSAFNVRVEKSWNQRLEGCPLVEVPPHGRLIDADRFMDDNDDGFEMNWDNEKGDTIGRIFAPFAPVKKALDKAPTIIEASNEIKAR